MLETSQTVQRGCKTCKVACILQHSSPALGPAATVWLSPTHLLRSGVALSRQPLACAKPGMVCSWPRLKSSKGLCLDLNFMDYFRAELMSVLRLCLVCYSSKPTRSVKGRYDH